MGGEQGRSQSEMLSGQGDRKPLCNLVRLVISTVIKLTVVYLYTAAVAVEPVYTELP